jgi:hypothetical protein
MKFIDLTGKRFGRLIVNKYIGKNKWGISLWLCKCDCGKEKIISSHNLKSGDIQSCGCFKIEINKTKRDNWKKEEVDILKKFYSEKGAIWCADKLKRPLCRVKHKIRYFDLHTKNRNGKSPIEIIYKIDETTAIASCLKHGICRHYKKKKKNNLTCCICLGLSQKERNKTEEGRVKQRERSRKWRKNPVNRFAANLRKRLRESFNRISKNGCQQTRGCFRNLDYTPVQLYNYLENIKRLQDNKCPHCNTFYNNCVISIDHIIPLIKAKTEQEVINLFDLKNLSLLCKDCNSSKNDNNFQEWNKRKDIFNNCVLDSGIVVG